MSIEAKQAVESVILSKDNKAPFLVVANVPEYRELNRTFVKSLPLAPGQQILDLACGPGNISREIAERISPGGTIYALDMSQEDLVTAKEELQSLPIKVHFVQSWAENCADVLRGLRGKLDGVVCGNAIHNFEEKEKAVTGVADLLHEGAFLAFNTAYASGAVSQKEREEFYTPWVMGARTIGRELLKSRGQQVDRSEKIKKAEAVANELGQGEYEALVERHNLRVIINRVCEVKLSLEFFKAMVGDIPFVKGSMPRFSISDAQQALTLSAERVFKDRKVSFSPRRWLELVAVKISDTPQAA